MTRRYTDEERERILQEAHDLLAVRDAERELERANAVVGACALPLPEDPLVKFRAKQAELAAARERARAELRAQERQHLAAAAAARRDQAGGLTEDDVEILGEWQAMERERMRDEISEAVGQLRAELTIERAHGGGVLDLPRLPLRRRGAV